MDERKWAEFRARERGRAGRIGALIIGPFGILILVMSILAPMEYPVGDVRNSIAFRLVVYGLSIAFTVLVMVASARWLLDDRRRGVNTTTDSESRARD